MLRIVMVIPTIDAIGGAERQVLLLAIELRRRGHEVTVIALSGDGGTEKVKLAESGVLFVTLAMRKAWIDPRGWRRYVVWAREHRPQVVHAHLAHASWFARWVRLICPVRVVVDTIHTSNVGGLKRRLGYRLSDWLSDEVTCVSSAVAESAARISRGRTLTIVPNGVLIPEIRRQDMPPGRRFQWIAVGRLERVKDYPTLLGALAMLPDAALTIAGAGRDEAALHALCGQLGIEDRVSFAGFQQEVDPLLRAADAFVLSSLWEGLPVSVLEAQAIGLPVVATDGRGTTEAMVVNETGLAVPVGDVEALAGAMRAIMAISTEERAAMGRAGRAWVAANFSLPVVVEHWERLYTRLLEDSSEPGRFARSTC